MTFIRTRLSSPLSEVSYNSPESKNFLNMYNQYVHDELMPNIDYVPNKTFTPSSIRCKRMNWFRLRGTKPEISEPDVSLKFKASIGTFCHEQIQGRLQKALGDDWLNVESYLKSNPPKYEYSAQTKGYETKIHVKNPPVNFSCDGLVKYHGTLYLLEIKTSEFQAMRALTCPKAEHMDQIMCYCTLIGVDNAMVLYQDRQYGNMKCFTYHLTPSDRERIVTTFEEVQSYVKRNIAPEKLPDGDKWCSPSYCMYYHTCKKWG